MMVVDGRRLLRALAFGFAVFLLIGGGAGFVVAAGERADDKATFTLPAPRPGDRAVYSVRQSIVDESIAKGDLDYFSEATYEWMPERWELDGSFQTRLVHPLRYTFLWAEGTQYEHRYIREALYDAFTGEPVRETQVWDGEGSGSSNGWVSIGATQGDSERHTRFDGYRGQVGACGFSLPIAGHDYDGKSFPVRGNCDWPGGHDAFTFMPRGWKDTARGPTFLFGALEDTRFGYQYDETSPFPVWLTSVLSEAITADYTYGRYYVFSRVSSERGTGSYTPLAESAVQANDPVDLVPRTPWSLDDSGVEHRFPLSKAYEAVMAEQPFTPRCPQCSHQLLPDWLAKHPDAYLTHGSLAEYRDRFGSTYLQWDMIWTDGHARLGKQVQYGPDGVRSVILPEATGDSVRIYDWDGEGFPYPDHGLALPSQVPPNLPRIADLLAKYSEMTGFAADRYGFGILCANDGCTDVLTVITAGRDFVDLADPMTKPVDDAIRSYDRVYDGIQVTEDGTLRVKWMDVESQEAVFPALLPTDAPPAQAAPASGPEVVGAWAFPAAPAAATGVSLLALLAGALYYFWPAVKSAPALGLFSRIRDDRLLDHPVRRRVHDAVLADPGVHFQELSRRLELGHGTLDHHLRKLLDAELLILRKAPGYTCYFPKATDRRVMDAAPALRSDGSRAVLSAVAERPGTSSRDLAVQLGLAPSTVSYHLKKLETAGLVLPDPRAGVRLTPLGEQAKAAA